MRPLPQLHGRPQASVRLHPGRRRRPHGRLRRVHRAADDERLEARAGHRSGRRVDLRPLRQCGAHRARLSRAGRGRADHRGGSHRHHGRRRGASRRRAARRRDRHEPLPARARAQHRRHPRARREQGDDRRCPARARHDGRLRRGPRDVGQPCRTARHAGQHGPRRPDRDARDPDAGDRDRLGPA